MKVSRRPSSGKVFWISDEGTLAMTKEGFCSSAIPKGKAANSEQFGVLIELGGGGTTRMQPFQSTKAYPIGQRGCTGRRCHFALRGGSVGVGPGCGGRWLLGERSRGAGGSGGGGDDDPEVGKDPVVDVRHLLVRREVVAATGREEGGGDPKGEPIARQGWGAGATALLPIECSRHTCSRVSVHYTHSRAYVTRS